MAASWYDARRAEQDAMYEEDAVKAVSKSDRPLPGALEDLYMVVDILEATVKELEVKLQPVLGSYSLPSEPSANVVSTEDVSPESHVVQMIRSQKHRVNRVIGHINELMYRLDA